MKNVLHMPINHNQYFQEKQNSQVINFFFNNLNCKNIYGIYYVHVWWILLKEIKLLNCQI